MTYYEGMEERPHAQTPKIPPTAGRYIIILKLAASHLKLLINIIGKNPISRITQSARKFFEEEKKKAKERFSVSQITGTI